LLKKSLIIGFGLLLLFPSFNSREANAQACPVVTIPKEVTYQDGWHDNWEGCECTGYSPTITGSTNEVHQNASIDLSVTSSDLACPPYTWTLDQTVDAYGSGFSLSKGTTGSDSEVNVLSTGAAACGGAVITVTDACGLTDIYRVRCPDSGVWVVMERLTGIYQSDCNYDCMFTTLPFCFPAPVMIVGDWKWGGDVAPSCTYEYAPAPFNCDGTLVWKKTDWLTQCLGDATYPPPVSPVDFYVGTSCDNCVAGAPNIRVPVHFFAYRWQCPP